MASDLSEMEKLAHLLQHWQEHNDDHIATYNQWADRADAHGQTMAADFIRQAAKATAEISELFTQAKSALDPLS